MERRVTIETGKDETDSNVGGESDTNISTGVAFDSDSERVRSLSKKMRDGSHYVAETRRARQYQIKKTLSSHVSSYTASSDFEDQPYEGRTRYPPRGEDATAEVQVVDWDNFEKLHTDESQPLVAITILAGEPGTAAKISTPNWFPGQESCAGTTTTEYASAKYAGHEVLPERICIGSIILINILKQLGLISEINNSHFRSMPVTLLRPYRTLTQHDAVIRKEYHELVAAEAALRVSPSVQETKAASDQNSTTSSSDLHQTHANYLDTYAKAKNEMEHMACLVHFIDDYLEKRITWLNSMSCDQIFFSDIWHMYKPGNTVISPFGKKAYRVASVSTGKHKEEYFMPVFGTGPVARFGRGENQLSDSTDAVITCVYIDYDGVSLGYVSSLFNVKQFRDQVPIASLPVIPLRCFRPPELTSILTGLKDDIDAMEAATNSELETLRQRLINRGRRFVHVSDTAHMYYSGPTADKGNDVKGHVVIDMHQALVDSVINSPDLPQFIHDSLPKTREAVDCDSWCCRPQNVFRDTYLEGEAFESFVRGILEAAMKSSDNPFDITPTTEPPSNRLPCNITKVKENPDYLTDSDYMIMHYKVCGYVLHDHKWERLDMDYVSYVGNYDQQSISLSSKDVRRQMTSIQYDSDDDGIGGAGKLAFSSLVIPHGHKRMIQSLVSQHFRNKVAEKQQRTRVDIVQGKGKGLVILLHGAPGVGKTTTAEGVAEMFKKPLLQMTCGDLGNDAKEVESSLQKLFSMASRWDAILLLDEADVFLAARGRNDFTRNGLVAVFLRVLEYYTGILFLTTNRIGDIDEAFTSRIHMILYYPHLDELTTVKICRLNLDMIQERFRIDRREIKIDKDEIEEHIRKYWRSHDHARWNGRQVRNACQTALALAEYDAQPPDKKLDLAVQADSKVHLMVDHVQRVSQAYLEFHNYLKDVYGTTTNTRAKELGLRAMEMLGEESLEGATSLRPGRARQRGRGRYSGADLNPLDGFRLPTTAQASDKQHPQSQYQQPQYQHSQLPQQPYQYQQQPQQQSLYPQQYQQPPSGSQPAMYQPHGQFVPTSHASMSMHGQPPTGSSATTVASFATDASFVSAAGSMQVPAANPYSQPIAQPIAQPIVQPIVQQPAQDSFHPLPSSSWHMTPSPSGLPMQSSQFSGPNPPDQPAGPTQ